MYHVVHKLYLNKVHYRFKKKKLTPDCQVQTVTWGKSLCLPALGPLHLLVSARKVPQQMAPGLPFTFLSSSLERHFSQSG